MSTAVTQGTIESQGNQNLGASVLPRHDLRCCTAMTNHNQNSIERSKLGCARAAPAHGRPPQPTRCPSASMISSPSSFASGPGGRRSRRSSTSSLGRHSLTPFPVQTIGRFTRTGCWTIADSNASSSMVGSRRPSSFAGDLLSRSALRGLRSAAANRPSNCARVQPTSEILDHRRLVASSADDIERVA